MLKKKQGRFPFIHIFFSELRSRVRSMFPQSGPGKFVISLQLAFPPIEHPAVLAEIFKAWLENYLRMGEPKPLTAETISPCLSQANCTQCTVSEHCTHWNGSET